MQNRTKKKPVNPTWEQMVNHDPILAFSFYLWGRKNLLLDVANEIVENLDKGFSGTAVDFSRVDRAESLMWLWTLGAYEVVRTMCQAKGCFSQKAWDQLVQLKKFLAKVRMPAAKMEKAGKKSPVTSNRSAAGWDASNRDLLIGDPEPQENISARFILTEFDRVLQSITKDDVLSPHEASYSTKT